MTPQAAFDSSVFRFYACLVAGLLVVAGVAIPLVGRLKRKDVGSVWRTYVGWLIMIPLIFAAVVIGRWGVIAGVTALAIFAFKEFARATGLYRDWGLTLTAYAGIALGGVATLVNDPFQHVPGWWGTYLAMPVYVISALLAVPIVRNRAQGQLQLMSLAILGYVYVGWMFGYLGWLANTPHAYGYLLYLLLATELNDVAAFTCGKLLGRHKLRSNISPNKTVEGSLGAVVVSLLLPLAVWFSFPHFTWWQCLLAGLTVGVGGQLGDLAISVIKRDVGIKDMGVLIPGHGGLLDRIDSLIFVAPLFVHQVNYFHGLR
jgi:phosphatidate cytidylyltransferase